MTEQVIKWLVNYCLDNTLLEPFKRITSTYYLPNLQPLVHILNYKQ